MLAVVLYFNVISKHLSIITFDYDFVI